jgi:pescadillo
VDYKVMGTFLEFYRALLKFINFKLFTDLGHKYPLPANLGMAESQLHLDSTVVQEL